MPVPPQKRNLCNEVNSLTAQHDDGVSVLLKTGDERGRFFVMVFSSNIRILETIDC